MASATTRDHDEIQAWAQAHGATPAVVSRTGGMLRFEFSDQPPAELASVGWEEFFRVFDEKGLELVYDDKPGSRFHKLVYPETVAGQKKPVKARATLQPMKKKAAPATTAAKNKKTKKPAARTSPRRKAA